MSQKTDITFETATDLDALEKAVCECGAAGMGEGHCEWCPAEMWDRIPEHMYAHQALPWVKAEHVKSKQWLPEIGTPTGHQST